MDTLMTMNKPSFKNISWLVTEAEYREDKALSYSTLSKYERSGFNELASLFDKIETPSLTFGSAVDSIMTGGMDEFNERFIVAQFPQIAPSVQQVVMKLFNCFSKEYSNLDDIPTKEMIEVIVSTGYQPNWKPETRAKVIREQGDQYYKLLYLAKDKTLIDTQLYQEILNTVEALKTSPATKWYFQEDNPFENIERLYQLKFKTELDGVNYRCMADLIVVDHDAKIVQPVDLKTSSKKEWDFFKSFIDWRYDLQARLYWRIIKKCMSEDPYFKDFKLMPYQFIVANKTTLTPLVWGFPQTEEVGTLRVGRDKQIELRDPCEIGRELNHYLTHMPKVPMGIRIEQVNDLDTWLGTL